MASLSRHEVLLKHLILQHNTTELRANHGTVVGTLQKLLLGRTNGEIDILVFDGLGTFRLYERKDERPHRVQWTFTLSSLSFAKQQVASITFSLWPGKNTLVLEHVDFGSPYNRLWYFMQEVVDTARWHILNGLPDQNVICNDIENMSKTAKSGPKIARPPNRRQRRVLELETVYAPMFPPPPPPPPQPEDFIVLGSQEGDVPYSYLERLQEIEEARRLDCVPRRILVPATPSPTSSPRNVLRDFEVAENVVGMEEENAEAIEKAVEEAEVPEVAEVAEEAEEEEEAEEVPFDDAVWNMQQYKGTRYHRLSAFHVASAICSNENDRFVVFPKTKKLILRTLQARPTAVRFPRLEIRKSTIPDSGCGLFAGETILPGKKNLITEYGGILLDPAYAVHPEHTHVIALTASVGKDAWRLDGRSFQEEPFRLEDYIARHEVMQMANSSVRASKRRPAVSANAAKLQNDIRLFYDPSNFFMPRPRVFIYATKRIEAGEEIFFDYSRGKATLVDDDDSDE